MAATKSAGRVSIRVLPDSTRFREDLKKTLDRIENSMKVRIKVEPILDNKQLAEMKRRIEELAITIKPHIDLSVPHEDIERIKQTIESMDAEVTVNTNLDTAGAAARISALTRARIVPIIPTVMKGAAENFNKHLAAIAGASYITQEIDKGIKFLRNIDTHAVAIAKQATLIGSVIAGAAGLLQGVFALGDGLIQTTALLTVAPALLSSMGIAAAVFIVALKDMKTVLADLGPAFTTLADEMSVSFWNEAAEPIREMTNHLMPTLSEKMILASTSMGKLTGQIAASFKEHVTIEKFALMFDRVLESMETVRGAVDPLIEAFTILGMHGTKYLDRLSKSIVKLTEDFRDWLKVNDENGNLTKWTEDGIKAFKDLGGVIKGVWDIFGALNTAIKAAGGPSLADLHRGLDNLAAMMQSEQFQTALTGVFRGMNHALGDIGRAIVDLGPSLATLAPTIERIFVSLGDTVATLLGYFGQIMEHPFVRKGLTDLFEGINKGVKNLAPAIEPFSVALGSLLTLLGTVLENVGALVATIMTEWGPSLQTLSDTFDTLATPLREMLEDVVRELTPAIKILVEEAIVPLLEWIRDHLIPAMSDFAKVAGPELVTAAQAIADIINDYLIPALTFLTDQFKDTDGEGSNFKKGLEDIKQLINDPENWAIEFSSNYMDFSRGLDKWFGEQWDGMYEEAEKRVAGAPSENILDKFGEWCIKLGKGFGKSVADMWNNIDWAPKTEGKNSLVEGVQEKWDDFATWWDGALRNIEEWGQKLRDAIKEAFGKSAIGQAVGDLTEPFKGKFDGLDGLLEGTKKNWDSFWGKWKIDRYAVADGIDVESMEPAAAGIDIKLEDIKRLFDEWWPKITEGWGTFWEGFTTKASETWEGFSTGIGEWWTGVSEGFAEWWAGITEGWNTFWDGFGTKFEETKTSIKEGFSTWFTDVRTGFDEWWTGITDGWNNFWTGFGEKFTESKDGIKTGFSTWWAEIKEGFTTWWEDIKTGWNDFWAGVGETTSTWWTDIKTTISTKIEEIKQGIATWIEDQKAKIRDGWQNIKNDTATKWAEIKQELANKWNEIVNYVPGKLQEFTSNVRNGFESARQAARDKLQELVNAVREKLEEAVNWVRGLPQRMINALTGTSLYQSGRSLLSGFVEGIRSMGETAANAARDVLQRVRNLFPHSPAKEGPFSGKGWTLYSGEALIDGFAEGMDNSMNSAVHTARRVNKGISGELNSMQANGAFSGNMKEKTGGDVNLNIYNPIAEPTSKTIARASSMIKLGGK